MTTLEQAARQALEALESIRVFVTTREKIKHPEGTEWYDNAITALSQALEQKQEPVVNAFDVNIDGRALQVLDGMVSPSVDGDRNPVRLIAGEGNSDYGLYISREGWTEDDATLLADIPPLYTEPQQREWVGLTDEEIRAIDTSEFWNDHTPLDFARVVEVTLKF